MRFDKKIARYIKDGDYRFLVNAAKLNYFPWMSDEEYIKRKFKAIMGCELNLDNPATFNEKIQWLKLHNRDPLYTRMVDKYDVKKYVADIVGEQHVIPTIGVWDSVDAIDFDKLPEQFVLKCTHDSHGLVICKDKGSLDIEKARKKLRKALKTNYYFIFREWPYKAVEPRVIAEEYMEDSHPKELRECSDHNPNNTEGNIKQTGTKGLTDYKIHCFNGEPRIVLVCQDRFSDTGMTEDFFDIDWNHLQVRRPDHPNSDKMLSRPKELDEMISLSRRLAHDIPFLRCDYYVVNGKVYLGELTFYPASGFAPFIPASFDAEMGSWIDLSTIMR